MKKTNSFKNRKKLILYELNEVPKKLIQKYIEIKPNSSFSYLLNRNKIIETITKDTGELHPWTTWPTLHRGVNNEFHKIKFINQPLKESNKYPPIWELLQKNGLQVGVFGSLQSYPPIKSKNISFYLPDTFAPTNDAYPKILENFQSFNLKVCNENKALSNKISLPLYFDFLKFLISGACSFPSASKLIIQAMKEKFNSKYCSRRSLMQPILSFDLYFKCLNKYKPDFSTFFSNHVAGIIHRYWRDIFPEDFIDDSYRISSFKKDSVIKAMDISDDHICRLLKYCKKNNTELWIASSMSQKARKDVYLTWDILLENFSLFLESFNLKHHNYSLLPAMQPDTCIQCKTYEDLYSLNSVISKIRDLEGNQIILERYKKDNFINISLKLTQSLLSTETLIIDKNEFKLKDIGLKLINRDPGTAYHTPEGILIKNLKDNCRDFANENQILDTTLIAPMILEYFGIDPNNSFSDNL